MKSKKVLFVLSLSVLFLNFPYASAQVPQEKSLDLNQIVSLPQGKLSLGDVVRELVMKYKVPIGFEESVLDREHDDYDFDTINPLDRQGVITRANSGARVEIKMTRVFSVENNWIEIKSNGQSLRDVLDSIVKQMRNYIWEIDAGVVNIIPKVGRDPRFKKLLDLKIANFSIEKGNPIGSIRTDIFSLPEVKEFLEVNQMTFSIWRKDAQYLRLPISHTAVFENLTLREILNQIALLKGGGWIIKVNKLWSEKSFELSV